MLLPSVWSSFVRRCRAGRHRHRGLVVLLAVALSMSMHVGSVRGAPLCWPAPVAGRVVDPFRAPSCPWCAGNRGLEYSVASRVDVRAVAPGEVSFAGSVAGVGYVVVRLDNGWRHTYGRLITRTVDVGDRVDTSAVVGRASGGFFFGLRIGDEYADPAPFIGRLVARPRLVPTDGSPPRAAPPASVRCATGADAAIGEPADANLARARPRAV